MSVIVTIEFPGLQADKFSAAWQRHQERLDRIGEDARSKGAIHHLFVANDDGTAMAVDEWDSRESCEKFLANQEDIKAVMSEFEGVGQPIVRSYQVQDIPERW